MEIINDINSLQDNISSRKNEPITNPNATIPLNDTQMTNGSHTMLQSQLKFICDKIEEALTQYRNAQQEKENEGRVQSTIIGLEGTSLKQKINSYNELTQNIKYKLETVYNINKIEKIESEIKEKKETVKKMKKENAVLNNINVNQAKAINEYQNKFQNKKEYTNYSDKVKRIKEDLKVKKEEMKTIDSEIKEQTTKIKALEEQCRIIKDNIEYKKKQQMKEVRECYEDEPKENNDIFYLNDKKTELENTIAYEEKQYKAEIASQTEYIAHLKDEINVLALQLKQIDTSNRIKELKKKELMKVKKRTVSKTKIQNKKPNTNYGRILSEELGTMSRTPNFKVKAKMQKPFEINKFNINVDVTNYSTNNRIKTNPVPVNNNIERKDTNSDMIAQIQNLKNEIQKALKNTNNANEEINNKQNILEKMGEQSAIATNNDISDIKNEFDYLKELELNTNNTNSKRKPFENINFK